MGGAFIFCKKRANTWVRPYGLKESLHHRFAMVPLPLGKGGFSAPYSVFCVGDGIYYLPFVWGL